LSFAVWLTGLSGSGKSAIARELVGRLHVRGIAAAHLESDVLRTQLTPFPTYEEAERDFFYAALAEIGRVLVEKGRPVIFDATANRRRYRDAARAVIGRFVEAWVDTPLEVCAARDPKGLYRDNRIASLPGVRAPYEPPLAAEIVLHGDRGTPEASAARMVTLLQNRGWFDQDQQPPKPER
jgi:adenylylsulfate kinase